MEPIRRWWNQPDHYDWLSGYLESQRLCGITRLMMTLIVSIFGAIPLLMRFSPAGPPDGIRAVLAVAVSLTCLGMAALWITRWPNRRQSKCFAVVSSLSMTVACLIDGDPYAGMLGCAAFGALAGYVAFFHTSRYLILVVGLALGTGAINAVRIGADGDPVGGLTKFLVIVVAVLAIPTSVQVVVHLLGNDAANSDLDPLTGLHNRRGFLRSAHELIIRAQDDPASVIGVVMVDIDGFKIINDTRGHAAGDRLLVTISDILRHVADDDCVVARLGGEEFTIAGTLSEVPLAAHAERVRAAVAALPDGITVSVGCAGAPIGGVRDTGIRQLLDDMVDAADRAMYAAKRAGGDQVRHASDTVPL
ncbi:MAG: GGDEF domain-containing protein [Mycolicibacterium sp.]|nr:GGDEF domain-containing protein [Mycolicibacterium sp.]